MLSDQVFLEGMKRLSDAWPDLPFKAKERPNFIGNGLKPIDQYGSLLLR